MVAFNTSYRTQLDREIDEAVEEMMRLPYPPPEVPVRRNRVDWGSVVAWGLVAGWFAFVFAAMARAGWDIMGRVW